MKKLFLLFILLGLACNSEDPESEITGEWQLVEVLADPGDGSGKFQSVDSNKRVTFLKDGTYTSNGIICDFTTLSEETSGGQYTVDDEGYLISCSGPIGYNINLRLEDGFLIISFPCIEPCLQKFRKSS